MKRKDIFWWLGALTVGTVLGLLGVDIINGICNFIATVYTRLFQFLAVPTVALAIMTTLISFGKQQSTRRIFGHTITYTLLTTLFAALVGMGMFLLIAPQNIPADILGSADISSSRLDSDYLHDLSRTGSQADSSYPGGVYGLFLQRSWPYAHLGCVSVCT